MLARMNIGPYSLANPFFVAPMAGVTDRPFRQLCKKLGAAYAVSEMLSSRPDLWHTPKSARRANHEGESGPIAVQISGTQATMMADAARYNIDCGAQVIDINMGCPAKKVCNQWAGSALMQDEARALSIIEAVVGACAPRGVPVTLKMRSGWSPEQRNALNLARDAERAGVQMVVVHGRTRAQGYRGEAEYETVAAVKAALKIAVVANGDIDTPAKACQVLRRTGVDAVMIGRAAQGRPWIFREMAHHLATGESLAPPLVAEVRQLLLAHLQVHYSLYGEVLGVRTARKHIGWYLRDLPGASEFLNAMHLIADCERQTDAVAGFLDELGARTERLPNPTDSSTAQQVQTSMEVTT